MIKPTITVKGQEAILKNIERAGAAVKKAVKQVIIRTAWQIHNDAKYMCPVDTGRLRASISVNASDSGQEYGEVKGEVRTGRSGKAPIPSKSTDGVNRPGPEYGTFAVAVGTNVEYAEEVEGRSPYLWPAFAMNERKYLEELAAAARTELEKI
jgi:hypothetical protein